LNRFGQPFQRFAKKDDKRSKVAVCDATAAEQTTSADFQKIKLKN
jgi:hypothetical protein